ncbi:MAG TPA: alpha/beta hydrolase [Chitinispirillaceae bacterium]|nr:alpha/beta hydrolase [Chitinispirillaceae bacterium]
MTKNLVRLVHAFLSLYLRFVPDSFPYEKKRASYQIPSEGWRFRDWKLKELISPQTKIRHRFFIHQSKKNNAPVFLFLHGMFLDGRNFINIDQLAENWTLIAYDFPERSSYYNGDMNNFVTILNDFLNCMKVKKLFLCGVSFGGGVSIKYAADNPERMLGLVLVSTFVMNNSSCDVTKNKEMSRYLLRYPDAKLYWLLEKLFKRVFNGKRNPMRQVLDILYIKQMEWYRQAFSSIASFDGPQECRSIHCPVLAIHGDADKAISLSNARSIPRFIPQTAFKVVEHGTHAMMYLQGSVISQIIQDHFRPNL